MSSLWTPGGEVPIDRGRTPGQETAETGAGPASEPQAPPGEHAADDAPTRDDLEQMRRQLLDAPAADVVAQHAIAFYELAAMHLAEPEPRLTDARLAVDAFAALVEGLEGRLGEAEGPLSEALPQLKMAYVEAADRTR